MRNSSTKTTTEAANARECPIYPPTPADWQADSGMKACTYQGVCVDFKVVEGFTHKKYQSDDTEVSDFVCLLFEVAMPDGTKKHVPTRMMKISLYEKSRLFGFLKDWDGGEAPTEFDADSLMGRTATVTVATKPGKKNPELTFANVARVTPPAAGPLTT